MLCPDQAEVGTNALLRWRDQPSTALFWGQQSAPASTRGRCGGRAMADRAAAGLSLDIDLPADLDRVRRGDAPIGERTSAWFQGYQVDLTVDATQHAP